MKKARPSYKFLFATYDYGKNIDHYFPCAEFAVCISRHSEGPNDRAYLTDLEDHEIAQKIVFMVEASHSWYLFFYLRKFHEHIWPLREVAHGEWYTDQEVINGRHITDKEKSKWVDIDL